MSSHSEAASAEMRFVTLAEGLLFAEGPVVTSGGGLLCVEVLAGKLTGISPEGETRLVAHVGLGPNGAAIGPDGRCYIANNGGLSPADLACLAVGKDSDLSTPPTGCIQVVDLGTGAFDTLYDRCDGTPLIAPNDLVFDRVGGFYFTDYGSLRRAAPERGRPGGAADRHRRVAAPHPRVQGREPRGDHRSRRRGRRVRPPRTRLGCSRCADTGLTAG